MALKSVGGLKVWDGSKWATCDGGSADIEVTPYTPTPYVLPADLARGGSFIDNTTSYTYTFSGDPRFLILGITLNASKAITPPAGFTLLEKTVHPTVSGFEVHWFAGTVSAGSHAFTWSGNATGIAYSVRAPANEITGLLAYETGAATTQQDGRTQPVEVDSTDGTVGFWLCFTTKTSQVPASSVSPTASYWSLPPTDSAWAGVGRTGMGGAQLLAEGLNQAHSPFLAPGEGNSITGWFVVRLASGARPAATQSFGAAIETALSSTMGYAYLVLKDGEEVASNASGYLRYGDASYPGQPATLDAAWSMQSISKLVMCLATFALIEDEVFSLDTPFASVTGARYPNYGTNVDTVTIEDLLTMRSGLTITDSGAFESRLTSALASNANAAFISARYDYQNGVYGALQATIEEASGVPYRAYLEERVLGPIGVPVRFASPDAYPGLAYENNADTTGIIIPTGVFFGSQNLWMSARELAQLARALRSSAILQPATMKAALAYTFDPYRYSTPRGMFLTATGSYPVTSTQGVRAYLLHGPDGYDVVVTYNGRDGIVGDVIAALTSP